MEWKYCRIFEMFHPKQEKEFKSCSKLTFYTAPPRLSLACVHAIYSDSPSELVHHQLKITSKLIQDLGFRITGNKESPSELFRHQLNTSCNPNRIRLYGLG